MWYRLYGKRVLDVGLAAFFLLPTLVLSCPLMVISALVLKGKIFFVQERLGYRNKVFTIYKFATLLPLEAGKEMTGKPEERQTFWGKFLRDYSLDELPQLLNILKGDMSFVGPRPLLPEYQTLYTAEEVRRHEVKPGLSGLAQVSGRNALSWQEKMHFDQQYVARLGLWLDVKILFKTFVVALRGQQVNYGAVHEPQSINWEKA